jgi:hypothetical protein
MTVDMISNQGKNFKKSLLAPQKTSSDLPSTNCASSNV